MRSSTYPRDVEQRLANKHVIAYLKDKKDPSIARLAYIFPYQFHDAGGRLGMTVHVLFSLPSEKLDELLEIVKTTPDAAEQFYQIAASGLDHSIQRQKSTHLSLVDLETFIPVEQFQPANVSLHQMVYAYPNRLNTQGITELQYSQAYGSVSKV